jgi:hypothetical protein
LSKKVRIVFILLTLGFFLIPGINYACNNRHSEEMTVKETKENSCEKECCKKNNSKEEKHNCDEKCHHANCTVSFQLNAIPANEFIFERNNFNFATKKQNCHYNETGLSAGFTSIWLRPKIG